MKNSIFLLYIFVVMNNISCGQNTDNDVQLPKENTFSADLLIADLEIPWGMAFLPDGGILVTEKAGELILFKNGIKTNIQNLPEIYLRGQGGLLDIALHPDYEDNGWVYFTYASEEGEEKGGHTALMRAKIENNSLINRELLYKASPNTTKGQHFGSRIEFDDQGFLYFSIGERGERDINPQNIKLDGGKIYRLSDDGSVPADNPFVSDSEAKSAIYTFGNRNPQGMSKHPETGEIWIHEHGPQGGDEINIIKKGANYGWPLVTYGINYSGTPITDKTEMEGMEQPLHYWDPSIAPSGLAFVTSDKYPSWKGNILVGSLAFQYLERLVLEGNKVVYREKLMEDIGRVRNVKQGPDGFIYVAVEGKGIYKLIPN
ncbi:PQQ-dependent sugar dehydrogenase [Eudoraea chungangensis]|uniref:PQQ-dependent sugar dehydrogenase n=1 Tax=Eudoraea chungangensis TaxID=1481905 RepID=UPI0023EC66B1|nr:PQQ-dependent sugar dehydrogenase [Eudoraea chungangensis]